MLQQNNNSNKEKEKILKKYVARRCICRWPVSQRRTACRPRAPIPHCSLLSQLPNNSRARFHFLFRHFHRLVVGYKSENLFISNNPAQRVINA
jgi:hypothetical protein